MDLAAFVSALDKVGPYGVPAIMALLFYVIVRIQAKSHTQSLDTQEKAYGAALEQHQEILKQYKEDLVNLSAQHNRAAQDMRQAYDNNIVWVERVVALTERYDRRSEYLEKLIQTNIQCWQTAIQAVIDNQFCPRVRELGGK